MVFHYAVPNNRLYNSVLRPCRVPGTKLSDLIHLNTWNNLWAALLSNIYGEGDGGSAILKTMPR